MADCHPLHPWKQKFAMVCLVLSLPPPGLLPFPNMLPVLAPIKSLRTSRSRWLASPSLPATLFAHPFPDMFASAWLLSSPRSPQDRLVASSISATTSFARPSHTGFFYMAGWLGGRFIDGLGAHWMWVTSDTPHHAPHAAWLALGVFLPSLFFLCILFWFCFLGGWEAMNPG